MRIRYTGDEEARNLAIPGGFIEFPRMEWVDVDSEAERLGIRVDHAHIVAKAVVKQDGWELESAKKAAKTRAANAAEDNTPATGEEG